MLPENLDIARLNIMQESLQATPSQSLQALVNLNEFPLEQDQFRVNCKNELDENGVLVLPGFLTESAIGKVVNEAEQHQDLAYYTSSDHNVYLAPTDPDYAEDHPRNRTVCSSKGCITTDQIPTGSPLATLYHNQTFRRFLCAVLNEPQLHEYTDPLSAINLHYAAQGQELGWHFDNSAFAVTLLIQKPEAGGVFEYVKDVRNADKGDMSYAKAEQILNGELPVDSLSMDAGALVLFRGRNSMHRVSPTQGNTTRLLAVLAYNTEPGVALAESARMTFFGRLG